MLYMNVWNIFKFNNKVTRTMCGIFSVNNKYTGTKNDICSKLTAKSQTTCRFFLYSDDLSVELYLALVKL